MRVGRLQTNDYLFKKIPIIPIQIGTLYGLVIHIKNLVKFELDPLTKDSVS